MKLKKTTLLTGAFAAGFAVNSAYAFTLVDNDLVVEGHSRSNAINFTMADVAGDPSIFNTTSLDVTFSGGLLNFSLNTNFSGNYSLTTASDGTTYNFNLADFAIDSNLDGVYEFGVVLQDHSTWDQATPSAPLPNSLGVGLYAVTSWHTSDHFFEENAGTTNGGIGYGEWFYDGTKFDKPPVAIDQGTLIAGVTVDTGGPAAYSFNLDPALINAGAEFTSVWGTATCANDIIHGTSPAPVPGTLALLGVGLAGLAGFNRKKLAK